MFKVRLIGVEAAGFGLKTGKHAASICGGRIGILHGSKASIVINLSGRGDKDMDMIVAYQNQHAKSRKKK